MVDEDDEGATVAMATDMAGADVEDDGATVARPPSLADLAEARRAVVRPKPTDARAVVGPKPASARPEPGAGARPGPADEARLGPGADVGGYVIDGELAYGGMGVVYSATHPLIGKRAALKVLRPDPTKQRTVVDKFVLEARSINQLGHPNIIDIFAFGQLADGRSYYAMELLTGESLRARLERGGALHISEAASVIDETASALMAAHDKGLIHRDLKPDNVFMASAPGRWPEVKLLDWGLLKLVAHNAAPRANRTLAGSAAGASVYMSPEQARASVGLDHRTDIYALGVMWYELLAGVAPIRPSASGAVPPLQTHVQGLPDELALLIEAMISKEPDERPTLAAVRAVIKRLKGTKIPSMSGSGLLMPGSLPQFEPTGGGQGGERRITANRKSPTLPPTARTTKRGTAAPSPRAPARTSRPPAYPVPEPYGRSTLPPVALVPFPSSPDQYAQYATRSRHGPLLLGLPRRTLVIAAAAVVALSIVIALALL